MNIDAASLTQELAPSDLDSSAARQLPDRVAGELCPAPTQAVAPSASVVGLFRRLSTGELVPDTPDADLTCETAVARTIEIGGPATDFVPIDLELAKVQKKIGKSTSGSDRARFAAVAIGRIVGEEREVLKAFASDPSSKREAGALFIKLAAALDILITRPTKNVGASVNPAIVELRSNVAEIQATFGSRQDHQSNALVRLAWVTEKLIEDVERVGRG